MVRNAMTFYPLSMLTYHLKSCNLFSHLLYRIHNLPICSPVISSICTPPVQTVTVRQAQQIFSASIRHSTSSLCPVRFHTEEVALQLPSPVSDSRGTACTTQPICGFSSGKTDLKVLTDLHYRHFHRASCGCCLFCQHSFHLRYFTLHAERRKQFGRKMCHHIVDGSPGF